MKRKIEAFTLMEVTIAMLVSAICITICYTAYGIIGEYYIRYQQKHNNADAVLSLKHVMESDLLKSRFLFKTTDGLDFENRNNVIHYRFTEGAVLRKLDSLHTDTFKLAHSNLEYFFEQKKITEPDTLDGVSFIIHLEQTAIPVHLYKRYCATDLFN